MRLINTSPASSVGETIIVKNQYWLVTGVKENEIHLKRSWSDETLTITPDEFKQSRRYPSRQEIASRYPRLLRALRWACILSYGEAECAVHGYITVGPHFMGSEAVAHVGGSLKAIRHAIRCRSAVRLETARAKKEYATAGRKSNQPATSG